MIDATGTGMNWQPIQVTTQVAGTNGKNKNGQKSDHVSLQRGSFGELSKVSYRPLPPLFPPTRPAPVPSPDRVMSAWSAARTLPKQVRLEAVCLYKW